MQIEYDARHLSPRDLLLALDSVGYPGAPDAANAKVGPVASFRCRCLLPSLSAFFAWLLVRVSCCAVPPVASIPSLRSSVGAVHALLRLCLQAEDLRAERQRSIDAHWRALLASLLFALPTFLVSMVLPYIPGTRATNLPPFARAARDVMVMFSPRGVVVVHVFRLLGLPHCCC